MTGTMHIDATESAGNGARQRESVATDRESRLRLAVEDTLCSLEALAQVALGLAVEDRDASQALACRGPVRLRVLRDRVEEGYREGQATERPAIERARQALERLLAAHNDFLLSPTNESAARQLLVAIAEVRRSGSSVPR